MLLWATGLFVGISAPPVLFPDRLEEYQKFTLALYASKTSVSVKHDNTQSLKAVLLGGNLIRGSSK